MLDARLTMKNDKTADSLFFPILLFLLTIITRIPFTSKLLYHMDSVHFALALKRFDVTVHQPHPPGSFLYIMLGRLLNLFIDDANKVFVSISIIFSGLTVAIIYMLAKEIYERKIGLLAAVIAIVSPNLWFHGEIAHIYIVEAFFSTLIAFLCWRILNGKRDVSITAVILGIGGGIRPYTLLFLFPLWLFSIKDIPLRKIITAFLLVGLTCLAWFVPMIYMTGGWGAYKEAYRELLLYTISGTNALECGWPSFKLFFSSVFLFTVYGLGTGIFVLCLTGYSIIRRNRLKTLNKTNLLFFSLWIAPSVSFYLLVGIGGGVPGHALIFLPPLIILTAASIVYMSNELKGALESKISVVLTLILVIVNGAFFLFSNYPVTYRNIKDHDRELLLMLDGIRTYEPSNTAVFVIPYVFYGYRHIMYYLPDYRVYDVDLSVAKNGEIRKVFWGLNRNTSLTKDIILPVEINNFVTPILLQDGQDAYKVKEIEGLSIKHLYPADIYLVRGHISGITEIYPRLMKHLKIEEQNILKE